MFGEETLSLQVELMKFVTVIVLICIGQDGEILATRQPYNTISSVDQKHSWSVDSIKESWIFRLAILTFFGIITYLTQISNLQLLKKRLIIYLDNFQQFIETIHFLTQNSGQGIYPVIIIKLWKRFEKKIQWGIKNS